MKHISALTLLIIICGLGYSQNRSVNLLKNEPYDKVAKLAKKENKLLFLDFGSPRCSPCLYMKNNIFTIDSVADFVNEHFISVDYTEGDEKKRLSGIYGVYSEPVFLIVDPLDGKLLHRTQGKSTAGEMLERFRQGMDRENNLAAQNRDYENGRRDPAFILSYINTLHIAGLRDQKQSVLENIFPDDFPLDSLTKPTYWELYRKFDESAVSRQSLFVMDNLKLFSDLYGERNVHSKIDILYGGMSRVYIFGKVAPLEDPMFKTILEYAQKSDHPKASEWLTYLVPAHYKFSDWVRFAKEIENAMAFNILKGDARFMYKKMMSEQLAWYCNDIKALPYSIKWIDELLSITPEQEKRKSLIETRESVVAKIEIISKQSSSVNQTE
ncbi:MAG: DUF255 domain-containing protein [Bacteroidales bacterium]|nr:DUF255 domain-containing protein [Bacteroidales bacterium]